MIAKEIMTKKVLTVLLDTTVKELAKLFTENDISGFPVVDENENLLGVVTENDIIDQNKKIHLPTLVTIFESVIYLENTNRTKNEISKILGQSVKDIYSKNIITISEDTSLQEIATIMSEKNIHLLPVLKDSKMVGIVGKYDIVKAIAKEL